jgi:hypothetical protein
MSEMVDEVASALERAIAAAEPGWQLLWAAVPTALLTVPAAPAPEPGAWPRARAAAATLLAGLAAGRGATLVSVDRVLFAYEGANPAATLEPVIAAVARARGTAPVAHRYRPAPALLAGGLRDLATAEATARRELHGGPPGAVTRALHAAVRSRARAVRALASLRPELVVLASQHSTASRSMIGAARAQGIPTAYLPHAPVADTYQYRDLPTEFAALRGAREVAFYRSLGAVRDPAVVGNPQGYVDPPEHLDAGGPIVFAPRPQPVEVVRAQVQAVHAAAPEVVVSPHPRMRGRAGYEGLWPPHWLVHDGRTVELLRTGDHPCVVQRSSGVAWEAMAHGIPVVELAAGTDGPPAYLVIREPEVRVCHHGDELAGALAAARLDADDRGARDRLMSWAGEWCAATGDEAVARACEWVEACAAGPAPEGPLLDRWAPEGWAA